MGHKPMVGYSRKKREFARFLNKMIKDRELENELQDKVLAGLIEHLGPVHKEKNSETRISDSSRKNTGAGEGS
jgi:hypothetical protein